MRVNEEFQSNTKETLNDGMTLGDLSDLLSNMCSKESVISTIRNKQNPDQNHENKPNEGI